MRTLVRRGIGFWKGSALIILIGLGAAYFAMMNTKRTYRAECTVVLKKGIQTRENQERDSAEQTKAKLKDMLTEKSRLEGAIREFKLFPSVVNSPRGIQPAYEEMKNDNVGFRASGSNYYYVSFYYPEEQRVDTPELVRKVTQYLADTLIADYTKTNLTDLTVAADYKQIELTKALDAFDKANVALAKFLELHEGYAASLNAAAVSMGMAAAHAPGTPGATSPRQAGWLLGKRGVPASRPAVDPALQKLFNEDPELKKLYGERGNLIASIPPRVGTPAPQPNVQVAVTPEEHDAARQAVNEAKSEQTQKCNELATSGVTSEHPNYNALKRGCDAAAGKVAAAQAKLGELNRAKTSAMAPQPELKDEGIPDDIKGPLGAVEAKIQAREKAIKDGNPSVTTAPSDAGAPSPSTMSDQVQTEQQFQQLLQAQKDSKGRLDDMQKLYDSARLAAEAAKFKANEIMLVNAPANKPTQATKGRGGTFIMVSMLGAILGLLYAAARVVFNDKVIDKGDLDALDVIPVLGVIPHLNGAVPGKKRAKA